MKTMQLARRSQKGVALLTTTIIIIIVAGMAVAFLTLAFQQSNVISGASESEITLHVAEAGIDDTINKLNAYSVEFVKTNQPPVFVAPIPDFAVIGDPTPVITGSANSGAFSVTIANSKGTTPTFIDPFSVNYILHSSATRQKTTRMIEVITQAIDNGNLFRVGLFGDVQVDALGTFSSDGFDSTKGNYASQPKNTYTFPDGKTASYVDATGNIGSNGSIFTGGNAQIMGNANPGPGGSTSGGGDIYGSTTPSPSPMPLDPVIYNPPAGSVPWNWPGGDTTLAGGTSGTAIDYHASSLNASGKGTLTVTGDVTLWVDGTIDMNNQQSIVLSPGAKLTIKQGSGDITINGQAFTNSSGGATPGLAKNFQIYSASSGTIKFNGGSQVYAAVYAPAMTFTNNGGNDFYGSLIAKSMKLSGTAYFHYDEDLARLSSPKPQFKIVSWREVLK